MCVQWLLADLKVARRGKERRQVRMRVVDAAGADEPAITFVLDQLFAAAGQPLRLALESGDPFFLRSLAARGFATAILPRSITALEGPGLEVRSLQSAVRLPVALVWRRERNAQPAARTFIDFVRRETTRQVMPTLRR